MAGETVADRVNRLKDAVDKALKGQLKGYPFELKCFKTAKFGKPEKFELAISCMKMQWGDWLMLEKDGIQNTWFQRVILEASRTRYLSLLGSACVHGSTRIPNPVTGETPTIQELFDRHETPVVMTLEGARIASVPFSKGFDDLYEVELRNGERFTCTLEHRLLTPFGYRKVSEIAAGHEIFSYSRSLEASTSESFRSVHASNALSSRRKAEDYQENYSTCSHPCGEPPPSDQGTDRSFFPSLIGAPIHSPYFSDGLDDPRQESLGSRLCRFSGRPSNDDILARVSSSEMLGPPHFHGATFGPSLPSFRPPYRFRSDTLLPQPSSGPIPDEIHTGLFCNFASLRQTDYSCGFTVSLTAVQSIRKSHHGEFFDLTVPEVHHYFAEGGIHHNSAGKTHGAAAWAYTFWKANFINTSVFLSTTSMDALENRIWGNVKDMFRKDKFPIGKLLEYKHCLISPQEQEDKNQKERDYRDSITGIPIPVGSEGERAIGSISGRKNEHVVWVVDELPHMDLGVLSARVNPASNEFFQWIGIGNKPNEGDPLYQDAEPFGEKYPDGWASVDPDVDYKWKTRTGVCLYFDGQRSPNMKVEGKPPFKGLMDREKLEQIAILSGGRDSPDYWRQGRGFPKAGDIQDRVLTVKILESFGATQEIVWAGMSKKCAAGLDLGFREDGDPCVADFGTVGQEHQGAMVLVHEADTVQLTQKVSGDRPYDAQIAELFLAECRKRDCHIVALDISGGGGTMALAIRSEAESARWPLDILPIEFGGSPSDEEYDVGGSKRKAKEMFDRRVSELWYSYRLAVQARKIRGVKIQCRAVKQLCERKVIMDEKKRWKVETKRDMKERIRRSPDDSDARVLLFQAARKAGLTDSSPLEKIVTLDWRPKPEQEEERKSAYRSEFGQRPSYRSAYGK
jgi:hypothetical protein